MSNFVHEDGQGNLFNDDGLEVAVVEMDVDTEAFPIELVTNYDRYVDLKPPEKEVKNVKKKPQKEPTNDTIGRSYQHYKDSEKEKLLELVIEKGMSARAAALKLNIKPRTAQKWVKMNEEDPQDFIERKKGSGRPVGRPPILGSEHQKFLIDLIDEKPSLVLDEVMDSLTNQFSEIKISTTGLYNFMTKECKISLKRAHFHSVDRNSPEKIENRFQWVTKWSETDMDFMSNCVFIDEAAFHINMKR
ncbi:hypothetical protein BD408DRAFT_349481, partial [Parasitella parasitica]